MENFSTRRYVFRWLSRAAMLGALLAAIPTAVVLADNICSSDTNCNTGCTYLTLTSKCTTTGCDAGTPCENNQCCGCSCTKQELAESCKCKL